MVGDTRCRWSPRRQEQSIRSFYGCVVQAGVVRCRSVGHTEASRRLRLRRPDRCATCDAELPTGAEAIWYPGPRLVTCVDCVLAPPPVDAGTAGASALREYERRHKRREDHARQKLGVVGVGLAKVIREPQSTTAWKRGGSGEVFAANRFVEHLAGTGVKLLHDRRATGHGVANIDHIAVGPGGVTVIDTKTYEGKVRVERVGGLFSERRDILTISGRDRTKLVKAVEKQVQLVRSALREASLEGVDVRGALCMTQVDGLPLIRSQSLREVLIDGPKLVSALARRPGAMTPDDIERIWGHLAVSFPSA